MQVQIENYMLHHYPRLSAVPEKMQKLLFNALRTFFHEKQINTFLEANSHKETFGFIEAILDHFNINIGLRKQELDHIPPYGKVIIIANHPLGALDALALIHLLKDVRKDIKIVANSFLNQFEQLKDIIIPVDNVQNRTDKSSLKEIYDALDNKMAVIIFPSGEVSRARADGIKDTAWKNGFFKIASKTHTPILPIYIKAKNSKTFYMLSWINHSFATATLPHEMFKSFKKIIDFKIGKVIAYDSYNLGGLSTKQSVKLLRKHFYRIAKGHKEIFKTQNIIATPEARAELKKGLKNAMVLGKTFDGKQILLYSTNTEDCVLNEIGRLRELSFRFVGEGSGKKRDIDNFDMYYQHLIVWDDEALEIAGAYRIGLGKNILESHSTDGLYTSLLFDYNSKFESYIAQGIELGRSFVQPKYWNSRALDYLWQGIGAFIKSHPQIRYLFGAVSLSDSFNNEAKAMIIEFYTHYFDSKYPLVTHKYPYKISQDAKDRCKSIFVYNDYKKDLQILKEELAAIGYSIPTLYKQYGEICEEGGVQFFDFGYDKDFGNCIDGFILTDLSLLKENKRNRYIGI
ncbi:MAG: lysophospholipid acyltransferase family protein [Sulfurovaceae bacterium]|nr:lysophospholipid acyltransferase family protein [Sulfurovaceae bacterium]